MIELTSNEDREKYKNNLFKILNDEIEKCSPQIRENSGLVISNSKSFVGRILIRQDILVISADFDSKKCCKLLEELLSLEVPADYLTNQLARLNDYDIRNIYRHAKLQGKSAICNLFSEFTEIVHVGVNQETSFEVS